MKTVAPIRKELGVKTFFNMLGPLVNPARPAIRWLECLVSNLPAYMLISIRNPKQGILSYMHWKDMMKFH